VRAGEGDGDLALFDKILAGMLVIRKYEEDPDVFCEHDLLSCGSSETADKMSQAERERMGAWGWFVQWSTWAHHV
jgi:hypothetical protein